MVLTVIPHINDLRQFILDVLTEVITTKGASVTIVLQGQVDRGRSLGDVILQEGLGGAPTLLVTVTPVKYYLYTLQNVPNKILSLLLS